MTDAMTNETSTSKARDQPTSTITDYGTNSTTNQENPNKNKINKNKNQSNSKIEPKVWLANERTFLNWCRTGILLGSFGIILINSSSAKGARILGLIYSFIAIGTISYGYFLYKKRIKLIEQKYAGHFDDLIAPIIISISLFIAILVNFILRVVDQQIHKPLDRDSKQFWIAAPISNKFSS